MKAWTVGALAAVVLTLPVLAQSRSDTAGSGQSIEEYLGVWYAFGEGSMPDKEKGEEPSRLVIFRDQLERIVVFLAHRAADRQIKFYCGLGRYADGILRFTDEKGFRYRLSFGENLTYGRFLAVKWDFAANESDLGRYLRAEVR